MQVQPRLLLKVVAYILLSIISFSLFLHSADCIWVTVLTGLATYIFYLPRRFVGLVALYLKFEVHLAWLRLKNIKAFHIRYAEP